MEGETLYDPEKMQNGLVALQQAFASYGYELEACKDIGENFFGSPDGALYTKKVSSSLQTVWDDYIKDDFGEFIASFDEWIGAVQKTGTAFADYKFNTKSMYERIMSGEDPSKNDNPDVGQIIKEHDIEVQDTEDTTLTGTKASDVLRFGEVDPEAKVEITQEVADGLSYSDALAKYGRDSAEFAYYINQSNAAIDSAFRACFDTAGNFMKDGVQKAMDVMDEARLKLWAKSNEDTALGQEVLRMFSSGTSGVGGKDTTSTKKSIIDKFLDYPEKIMEYLSGGGGR